MQEVSHHKNLYKEKQSNSIKLLCKQVSAWKVKLNSFTVKMRQTVVKDLQIIDLSLEIIDYKLFK